MWISTPCNSNFVHRYDVYFMLYTFENSAIFLTNFLLFPKSSSFSFRASVQILICELYVVLVISRNQCRFCHPLFVYRAHKVEGFLKTDQILNYAVNNLRALMHPKLAWETNCSPMSVHNNNQQQPSSLIGNLQNNNSWKPKVLYNIRKLVNP